MSCCKTKQILPQQSLQNAIREIIFWHATKDCCLHMSDVPSNGPCGQVWQIVRHSGQVYRGPRWNLEILTEQRERHFPGTYHTSFTPSTSHCFNSCSILWTYSLPPHNSWVLLQLSSLCKVKHEKLQWTMTSCLNAKTGERTGPKKWTSKSWSSGGEFWKPFRVLFQTLQNWVIGTVP